MSNFFSKYLGKIALTVAAVLWAGCNDVKKNSGNEKSASKTSSGSSAEILNPVESIDSAALKNAEEDSLSKEPAIDSIETNSNATVLLDSAKQLELKRTRDSLMKAFFPIELTENDKDRYRYILGPILKQGLARWSDSVRKAKRDFRADVFYYGVRADWGRMRTLGNHSRHAGFNDGSENRSIEDFLQTVMGGNVNVEKPKEAIIVLYENIKSANKQTLDQNMYSRVERTFRQRVPGLKHIYRRFLKKDTANTFDGKITLKLTIAADGTVKDALIISSTTGVKDFDENIINAVCRWTFSKVNFGKIAVYVTIRFYKEDYVTIRFYKKD